MELASLAGGSGKLLAQQEFHRPKLIKQIISHQSLLIFRSSNFHFSFHFLFLFASYVLACSLRSSFSVCFRLLGGGSLTPSKSRHITITLHATCYYADSWALVCDVRLTSEPHIVVISITFSCTSVCLSIR